MDFAWEMRARRNLLMELVLQVPIVVRAWFVLAVLSVLVQRRDV